MSKRNYNVFFNTHTVSGIVISVALYVIFFAGAFALFKDEIKIWESGNQQQHIAREAIDFDNLVTELSKDHYLTSRTLRFNLGEHSDEIYVLLEGAKDTINALEEAKGFTYLNVNINTGETATYEEKYNLGEFLYRLHFFSQIPFIGIYLAGFVAIFFLFAIVTGVIVHWKKIISNFYQFNPKVALKRVWTDAHTALGIIGLPFQFMYAVTSAYFCLNLLVLIPANILYGGDQNKLMEDLRPDRKVVEWVAESEKPLPSINAFVDANAQNWDDFKVGYLIVKNYGGANMQYHLIGELPTEDKFLSSGIVSYDFATDKTTVVRNPNDAKYSDDIQLSLGRLHFATYGGTLTKVVYFILALLTCFVIITGVLIWIEARNKKSMTLSQRLYTAKVGHIYLAICLSMLPVTALSFIFVRLTHGIFTDKTVPIYLFFFLTWLIAIFFYRFKRNNYFTNKSTLLLGAILGFLVPLVNGFSSGNWLFMTLQNKQYDIASVDMLWLVLSATALFSYFKIEPQKEMQSAFTKYPIDYKNLDTLKAEERVAQLLKQEQKNVEQLNLYNQDLETTQTEIPMRTKIVILWLFLGIGWIVHHIYGLFNIYYNETLIMDGATGEAPVIHHIYRILFEGLCLLFALLTIEVSKKWFKVTSLVWAIIAGLYNVYHFVTALIFESSNISEIFMLLLVTIASIFLIKNLSAWRKNVD